MLSSDPLFANLVPVVCSQNCILDCPESCANGIRKQARFEVGIRLIGSSKTCPVAPENEPVLSSESELDLSSENGSSEGVFAGFLRTLAKLDPLVFTFPSSNRARIPSSKRDRFLEPPGKFSSSK